MPAAQACPPSAEAVLACVNAWRREPDAVLPCPACGVPGLAIHDRSARPYAEWYQLACSACGLEQTLHIPMAPPSY